MKTKIQKVSDFFFGITYKMIIENNYPDVFKEVFRYGSKNIIFIYQSYWGCCFYNVITNKFFRDNSALDPNRFLPADFESYEENFLTFEDAIENNVNTFSKRIKDLQDEAFSYSVGKLKELSENEYFDHSYRMNVIPNPIKVTVSKGRKFKGEGYLINIEEETSEYGTTYKGVIYDPSNNVIDDCTLKYVNIHEDVKEGYNNWMTNVINNFSNDDFMSELDIQFRHNGMLDFETYVKELNNNIDYSSARNLIKEKAEAKRKEKEEKNKAFKEAKMKDLIEWVKKNTDKEGEEIEKLAERIYKKRYEY